jgi:hypothetical protein
MARCARPELSAVTPTTVNMPTDIGTNASIMRAGTGNLEILSLRIVRTTSDLGNKKAQHVNAPAIIPFVLGRPQEFERVRISRMGGDGGGVGGALPSGAQSAMTGLRRSWRLIIELAFAPSAPNQERRGISLASTCREAESRYRASDVGVSAQPGRAFDLQSGQAGAIDRRIRTFE